MFSSMLALHNFATSTYRLRFTPIEISLYLLFAILELVAFWKVFTKAGRPGWPAIIPVYNTWVLFEISGKPGWWALLALLGIIPIVGLVAVVAFFVCYIMAMLELAKRFGKSQTFAIFGLVIFNIIGLLILGFGDSKYNPKPPAAPSKPESPSIPGTPNFA